MFISDIGIGNFVTQAHKTFILREISAFYDNPMQTMADVEQLFKTMSKTHVDAFNFGIYFAAWIKSEVSPEKRCFAP